VKDKILLPVIFIAVFAASRIPGLMPANFSVAYAFAFCAGVFFQGRRGWWLPLATLLVTDIGLNFYYQHKYPGDHVWSAANLANLAFNYLAYGALIFLGRCFKPHNSLVNMLGGGLLGAILFYLITNTAAWLFNPFHNPEYTKTLTGWIIALTKGTSGYPATWEFFRNTLLSGGLFTALFGAAAKLTAESPADKTAGARAPEKKDGEDKEAKPEAEPEEANA
jgi:hypothetical protein